MSVVSLFGRHQKTVLLMLTLAVAGACKCGDQLNVRRVLVDVDAAAVDVDIDTEQVRLIVGNAVKGFREIAVDDTRADAGVLRVRIESLTRASRTKSVLQQPSLPTEGEAPAAVSIAVDIIQPGRAPLRGHSIATAHGNIDLRSLIEQALLDALHRALRSLHADKLSSDELFTWLTDPSTTTAQQKVAMQTLGSRREKKATAALTALLKSADPEIGAAALQSLTLMADEDAVDAIIDYSDRQPVPLRTACIDAVKATGSTRARPWLFTLSTGHTDAGVRAHALRALAALDVAQPRTAATSTR